MWHIVGDKCDYIKKYIKIFFLLCPRHIRIFIFLGSPCPVLVSMSVSVFVLLSWRGDFSGSEGASSYTQMFVDLT